MLIKKQESENLPGRPVGSSDCRLCIVDLVHAVAAALMDQAAPIALKEVQLLLQACLDKPLHSV